MIAKPWIKAENRRKYFIRLGGVAQITLVLSILLGRLEYPAVDFLSGLFLGFSLVGNLAFLYTLSQNKSEENGNVR